MISVPLKYKYSQVCNNRSATITVGWREHFDVTLWARDTPCNYCSPESKFHIHAWFLEFKPIHKAKIIAHLRACYHSVTMAKALK